MNDKSPTIAELCDDPEERVRLFCSEVVAQFWEDRKFTPVEESTIVALSRLYNLPLTADLSRCLPRLPPIPSREQALCQVTNRLQERGAIKLTGSHEIQVDHSYLNPVANPISYGFTLPSLVAEILEKFQSLRNPEPAEEPPSAASLTAIAADKTSDSKKDGSTDSVIQTASSVETIIVYPGPHENTPAATGPFSTAIPAEKKDLFSPEGTPAQPKIEVALNQMPGASASPAIPDPNFIPIVSASIKHRIDDAINNPVSARTVAGLFPVEPPKFAELMAFSRYCSKPLPEFLIIPESDMPPEVWCAGDIHGDLLGLESVFHAFKNYASPGSKLVLLGDIVDRGFHHMACLEAVGRFINQNPGTLCWIAGNHDDALVWKEDDRTFVSRVTPCEFREEIIAGLERDREGYEFLGRRLIEFVSLLPRALLIGKTFVAHGGFPHTDLIAKGVIPRLLDSNSGALDQDTRKWVLSDFVNNRMADVRMKAPYRGSMQSEFGSAAFAEFRDACARAGRPVESFVRGHDHVNVPGEHARYQRLSQMYRGKPGYEGRVLTVNTMTYNHPGEGMFGGAPNPRYPVMARISAKAPMPVPEILKIDGRLVAWYGPICSRCGFTNPTGIPACLNKDGAGIVCGEPLDTHES